VPSYLKKLGHRVTCAEKNPRLEDIGGGRDGYARLIEIELEEEDKVKMWV
jgi:hypothetical protein